MSLHMIFEYSLIAKANIYCMKYEVQDTLYNTLLKLIWIVPVVKVNLKS